jgi:transcriptional regulator with XRE-family HTH domain
LENLEWCTLSENTAHARRVLGSGLGTRKVHIITMQREDKYFDTVTEAAEFMGVAKGTISRWANGNRSCEGKARLVEYL